MDITLKNVKIYIGMSEETIAFNASVYIDGKKVGEAKNAGHGGNNAVDVRDKDGRWNRDLLQEMETEASKHTWMWEGKTHNHNLDSYIGDIVADVQEQRDLKRTCRNKTLYRIPNKKYEEGVYVVLKAKFDDKMKAYLVQKYGDKVEILNETIRSN